MRLVLSSIIASVVILATSGPALADSVLLAKADPKGDVHVTKNDSISKSKRKSIDIDKATITELDNGKYRFKVRIKQLYTSKKWDQMVFFNSTGAGYGQVSIGFRVRDSRAAYGYDEETGDTCALKVVRTGRTVYVDVPFKCAPGDSQVVQVATVTGHWQSDEKPWSSDRLRVGTFHYPE